MECSKGWHDRCAHSTGKTCQCACGGANHGTKVPENEGKSIKEINEKKSVSSTSDLVVKEGGVSVPILEMYSIGKKFPAREFIESPQRKRSPELDFGVWWRDGKQYPTYRVSWVEDTGEVYAISQLGLTIEDEIEVIGVVHGRDNVEKLLEGWAEACGGTNSLEWLRSRFE